MAQSEITIVPSIAFQSPTPVGGVEE